MKFYTIETLCFIFKKDENDILKYYSSFGQYKVEQRAGPINSWPRATPLTISSCLNLSRYDCNYTYIKEFLEDI